VTPLMLLLLLGWFNQNVDPSLLIFLTSSLQLTLFHQYECVI